MESYTSKIHIRDKGDFDFYTRFLSENNYESQGEVKREGKTTYFYMLEDKKYIQSYS